MRLYTKLSQQSHFNYSYRKMPRRPLVGAATLEDIDNFFSLNPTKKAPTTSSQPKVNHSRNRIRGRMIDEHGNPITMEYCMNTQLEDNKPSYQREVEEYGSGKAYVTAFKEQRPAHSLAAGLGNMSMDDTATVDQLETRSMTGSTVSFHPGHMFNTHTQRDTKVAYTGYRQGFYNEKLPITVHKDRIVSTIESTQCTIIQGMTGCGKTTQVPQYILDECARTSRRCRIAVTQPRRIAAISIARRVCAERGWSEGSYCGYQVARDSKVDLEKTNIVYMTTGILLQLLINDRNLDAFTHIILDEVHERDQDTDLALLIIKKFIHSVSPNVKVILMSATFDCQVFSEYFATAVRGEMQNAPIIDVEGKIHDVKQFYWSDSPLRQMVSMPRFDDYTPTVFPEAMSLAVKLLAEFDKMEATEQGQEIAAGKPVCRGTVLIFLPGLAEIQDLSTLIERDGNLRNRKLAVLPLHSSITLEEQGKVFDKPHQLYRKVILSTNIAESSITVPDIKYVIDFCLTKCLQTDRDTNMTCLKLEWASKANCKQRMGRAGRVSNGQVYRLVQKTFYERSLDEYGLPEMSRCPLTQLILKVKKLGQEEPRYILASALDPPHMSEIGKSVLLLKEAGALADPTTPSLYNPFDGQLMFLGEVLASLPLNIELGKLLVFGYMLGLLPECLIIAASMHTRSIFQQPFRRRVEAFKHKLKWDRGMHSDSLATVNAYKEWDRLREQEYFMRAPNAEAKWCHDNFLQKKTLHEVHEVIQDLARRLEDHGIKSPPRRSSQRADTDVAEEQLLLKVALSCAFYPHYFGQMKPDQQIATRQLSGKSPLNTVYMTGLPNNQGILYKRQIEKLIAEQIPGCKVHSSFENTRCYLEFDHAPGDCGVIPNAMYIALRMSHMKDRLELNLFEDSEAFDLMQRILQKQEKNAHEKKILNTNRMFLETGGSRNSTVPKKSLPSDMMTCIQLFVVHVEECGHFWAHECDEQQMKSLHDLQSEINKPSNIQMAAPIMNPVAGSLCIAPYEGQYFRAKIAAVRGNEAQVYFVDYGNSEVVNFGVIRQLLPGFKALEFQAIECVFAEIAPPMGGQYTPAMNQMFANMLLEKLVYCEIYSVDKGVLRLKRVVSAEDQCVDYHSILYAKGMVTKQEESFTSQQNHQLRYGGGCLGQGQDPSEEGQGEGHWGFGLDEDIPLPRTSYKRQTISGPFSPIELKFCGLAAHGRMKEVKVEPSSVNAIALDEEAADQHDRLMIAAVSSVNSSGNRIIARETTLMPNIHGLPALMCLLFAPSIIIRRDKQRKFYTGAICGLGADPKTGGSAFPDHDIELEFDVQFDVDDISNINNVKMAFNVCMGGQHLELRTVTKCQQVIRNSLKQLLNKKRESMEKVYSPDRMKWRQLPDSELLSHELHSTMADQAHLYRLVSVPLLEGNQQVSSEEAKQNSRIEFLKEHCKSLTKFACGPRNVYGNVKPPPCELCNVCFESIEELQAHIGSRLHRTHEYRLYN